MTAQKAARRNAQRQVTLKRLGARSVTVGPFPNEHAAETWQVQFGLACQDTSVTTATEPLNRLGLCDIDPTDEAGTPGEVAESLPFLFQWHEQVHFWPANEPATRDQIAIHAHRFLG